MLSLETKLQEPKMAKLKVKEIRWLLDVEEHDYPAAQSYLTILYNEERVAEMTAMFRMAPIVPFKAKDIFRASQLSLLGVSNTWMCLTANASPSFSTLIIGGEQYTCRKGQGKDPEGEESFTRPPIT
jgi:hypothetical protein